MDPYSVLGVSQSATPEEIRRVFRKLSLKYHPDRNPNDSNAEAIYKEVSKAYDLLTNPGKQGSFHSQPAPRPRPQPAPPPIVPVVVRGGRKKAGGRRGYMPPGHQPRPKSVKPGAQYTVPPTIQPGSQYSVPPDVKLGSVPLKDLPPWMPRATFFGHDPLDRGSQT